MSETAVKPLHVKLHPEPVELDLGPISEVLAASEDELRLAAIGDRDRCSGYFPALVGMSGIRSDLPACRLFAEALPSIWHAGVNYRFNFVRLSLVRQKADPSFHLDSDAATALTGDVATLRERDVLRLLLNLSSQEDRVLHYLNVDPWAIRLAAQGAYVSAEDPERLEGFACLAGIPPRTGTTVHGLAFASNRVLHSGIDGEHGHFIAAYGAEATAPDGTG